QLLLPRLGRRHLAGVAVLDHLLKSRRGRFLEQHRHPPRRHDRSQRRGDHLRGQSELMKIAKGSPRSRRKGYTTLVVVVSMAILILSMLLFNFRTALRTTAAQAR